MQRAFATGAADFAGVPQIICGRKGTMDGGRGGDDGVVSVKINNLRNVNWTL